jgi:polyisoprenoid-binding protein YceI
MKTGIVLTALLLLSISTYAQDKFLAKTGHIWFFSSTPMENIEAHNNQVTSYVDAKTGEVAFQMLVKSFKFDRALMEEHFNENYMESVKFPKAEFKGKIVNLSDIKFDKPGVYKAVIEGDLTIHGTVKKVKHEGTFEVKGTQLLGKAKFQVVPQDYKIEIPSLVKDKFAESMDVNVDIVYVVYKK